MNRDRRQPFFDFYTSQISWWLPVFLEFSLIALYLFIKLTNASRLLVWLTWLFALATVPWLSAIFVSDEDREDWHIPPLLHMVFAECMAIFAMAGVHWRAPRLFYLFTLTGVLSILGFDAYQSLRAYRDYRADFVQDAPAQSDWDWDAALRALSTTSNAQVEQPTDRDVSVKPPIPRRPNTPR